MNETNIGNSKLGGLDPHDPRCQLWALLLLASNQNGKAFTDLDVSAQRAFITAAYDKAFESLHHRSIDS